MAIFAGTLLAALALIAWMLRELVVRPGAST
jgi:hypothetical protein